MRTELALLLVYEKPVMSLGQVAELMGLAPRTLENKIYAHTAPVPMFKIERDWYAHVTDVATYIDEQRAAATKLLQDARQPA
ncbi:hypothetical protein D9M73_141280 [compost metagenome]